MAVVKVNLDFFQLGTLSNTGFHWNAGAGTGDLLPNTEAMIIANEVAALWGSTLKSQFSTSVRLERVRITQDGAETVLPVGVTGSVGASCLPPNCALLVRLKAWGSRNGRMYWPGVVETMADAAGDIVSPFHGQMQTAFAAFRTAMSLIPVFPDGRMVVKHVGFSVTDVESTDVRVRIASQRRRLG